MTKGFSTGILNPQSKQPSVHVHVPEKKILLDLNLVSGTKILKVVGILIWRMK